MTNEKMTPRTHTKHPAVMSRCLLGLCVASFLCFAIWPDTSWANRTMRCGNYLITKGTYQEKVLARCGEPYSSRGNYWLYRIRNVVFRVHFNSKGQVSWLKSEIVF